MSRRKQITSKHQFAAALELEKSGDSAGAIKLYQKATTTDPLNTHAWNRQMILYRKSKTRQEEARLIKTAISAYEKAAAAKHREWLQENRSKANSSRELAKVLGLLAPTGRPKSDDETIEKWKARLYLLEYRIKNARKISTTAPKKSKLKTKKK